jgi:O-antigen ligase
MASFQIPHLASLQADQRARLLEYLLVLVGGIAVATFILVPKAGMAVLIGALAVGFILIVGEVFRGKIDRSLLCWAAFFPLGYHFVAFPREQSIITLDRLVVLAAFLGFILAKPGSRLRVPKSLRRVGFCLFAFTLVAAASLGKSPTLLNAARVLLDSFLMPLLLAWCVIALFDVRSHLLHLHTAVCISSMISASVAAADMITGRNLLPAVGSVTFHAGDLVRPSGPFYTNDILALIGTVSFFFLLFLRSTMGRQLTPGRRLLHFAGLTAALGMALMPMFRSAAVTLLLALVIDTFWERGTSRRAWRIALIAAFAGLILAIAVFLPDVYQDRSSSHNIDGRIAEWEQTYRVFVGHPWLGVGFLNFHDFVIGDYNYIATYGAVPAPDWAHNNLGQVLTETGLLGFVPYFLTQILLLAAMWQLRRMSPSGSLARKYCLYFFLTYWITGLTESSGYSPLNLWFALAVTVVFKYAMTEQTPPVLVHQQVPDDLFSPAGSITVPEFLK